MNRTACLLLSCLVLTSAATAQIDFAPAVHYAAGRSPSGGAALDFDRDGHVDLVVSCRRDDALAFLRNQGQGTFAPPVLLPLANNSNPEGIAVGDFDRDGDQDLAVVLFGSPALQLVLANGNGTFTPGRTFGLGHEPSMIVAVDFNGDGWLDVAINERGGGDVAVLLNDRAGGFAAASFYPVGVETRDVTAGDVTGDGVPDLAVSSRDDHRVRVFRNRGDGTFQFLIDLGYGSQLKPHGLGMADMDGDGWLDFYSVSRGSVFEAPQVYWRFNGGNPWVGPANGAFAGVAPTGVCHGDFDLDGHIDIATCNADSNDVSVMRNAGIGLFNRGIEFPVGSNPDCPEMLAVDLDHDGDLDLVTFNEGSDNISVLRNRVRVCQEDLGYGGPGNARLTLCGRPFRSGNTADLTLAHAAANRPAWLVGSLTFGPTPVLGGVLVPIGVELLIPVVTDAGGGFQLPGLRGGGGPVDVFLQALVFDPTWPQGFAFSNAVRLQVLP